MSDSHLDRKDLKTPDAFFQGVGTANRFYHEHRIPMIVGTIAVVAFFLGIVSWRSSRHAAAESAAAAFLRATDAVEESSPESARSALQTVAESGATPYGALTGLYLAELELKGGNADAAAEAYGRTAKSLVAICVNPDGGLEYRGVRLSDDSSLAIPASRGSEYSR